MYIPPGAYEISISPDNSFAKKPWWANFVQQTTFPERDALFAGRNKWNICGITMRSLFFETEEDAIAFILKYS